MESRSDVQVKVQPNPEVRLAWTNVDEVRPLLDEWFEEIYRIKPPRAGILHEVLRRRHASVPELVHFTFLIKCSRAASHEIVRHRIATYWQESQRYVEAEPIFILPRSLLKKQEVLLCLNDTYTVYRKLIEQGARKELARYILPNAIKTTILCHWNLRELCEVVIPLRICRRAQPEFRYIAYKLLEHVAAKVPEAIEVKYVGPRCLIYGRCPEYGYEMAKCRECFTKGLKEAIEEHGKEDEVKEVATTVEYWVEKLFD